jgi:hypothetical protein
MIKATKKAKLDFLGMKSVRVLIQGHQSLQYLKSQFFIITVKLGFIELGYKKTSGYNEQILFIFQSQIHVYCINQPGYNEFRLLAGLKLFVIPDIDCILVPPKAKKNDISPTSS